MEYFRYLRNRLHFPTMQHYCRRYDLPTAQGWDKLEEKLSDACEASPATRRGLSETLEKIYKETIPLGQRAVRVFQLDDGDVLRVSRYLAGLAPEDCAYTNSYPAPLSNRQLGNAPTGAYLVEITRHRGSATLVFCSKRMIEEREQRSRADIGTRAIREFGWQEYDEFILIRRRQLQAYEIVRIDTETGRIELRVEDHTGLDVDAALTELQDKVNEVLAIRFGTDVQLINPVNLFPAIHPIYDDGDEGIVVELGFTTQTGSAKHEKMRQRAADLRVELFHVGGKAAIHGALTPFRIAVRWPATEERGQEEIVLPGSIRQLGTGNPWLDHMIVRGPVTETHMRECIARVVDHLPDDEDE